MSHDQPTVSIIIPHYRDFAQLDLCLGHLERQSYPRRLTEIVVADNASPEGAAAVEAAMRGRGRLVTVTDRGAGCARNGGVAAATGDILAFTDSDCVPDPDWLLEGVKALETADIVGGAMVVRVDDPDNMTACEGFETVFAFNNKSYVETKGFSATANLFCRRALFQQVGGFMAAGMAEDMEWCARALRAGHSLRYAPLSIVGHPARRTWPQLLKKWQRLNEEQFSFFCVVRKRSRMAWVARACAVFLSAFAHSPKVLRDRRLKSLALRLAVVGTLFRIRIWRLVHAVRLALVRPRLT